MQAVPLGLLSADERRAGVIAEPGDLTLYQFTTDDLTPAVEVRRTGCVSTTSDGEPYCQLMLVTLDGFGGQALWGDSAGDDPAYTMRDWSEHSADQGGEFLFVVTDYAGHGEVGYTYDLTVLIDGT